MTYSQLLSEDGAFTQRRAVPAAVSELVLAFVDAQLCPPLDHDDGVRPALADGALAGCETGDLIADDVRTKGHHRGKSPVGQRDKHTSKDGHYLHHKQPVEHTSELSS